MRKYLPDYDEKPERFMNRDFLFGIVNKVDPTFFDRATRDIVKTKKETKKPAAEITKLKVQPSLLAII